MAAQETSEKIIIPHREEEERARIERKKKGKQQKNLRLYWPLVSLVLVTALAGAAVTLGLNEGFLQWMHYFMGFFFCTFAMLKIFHPYTFAEGFQMYDILAQRSRAYALAYPLIELLLGLGYLSFFLPYLVYILTIAVTGVGAYGVIKGLRQGLDINCPCMGSVLDVPLSTVTLTEDIGMGLMALIMLITRIAM